MNHCQRCRRPVQDAELITQPYDDHCQLCHGQNWVDVTSIKPNPENPRTIAKAELKKLIRNIEEFGFLEPLLLNLHPDRENMIIGGHQRLRAATALGFKTLPVNYVRLEKHQEHVLNIALNKISGDWDEEALNRILAEITSAGIDVTMTGFEEHAIAQLQEDQEDAAKRAAEDIVPEAKEGGATRAQPGDVWVLGNHRLMCGDATKPEDVAKLMLDEKGDLVFTDPPYGVSYRGTNNPDGKDWGVMANDELRDTGLYDFLRAIFQNYAKHTKENPAVYCCYASSNHTIFETAMNAAGFHVKQTLIWEKGHVLGHSDYHWCHEPILYAIKYGKNCEWTGDRTHRTTIQTLLWPEIEALKKEELLAILQAIRHDSDVLSIQKDPATEYLHSTQKPVELPRRCLLNNSRPTQVVLDFCGGSGSTLIACESTNRQCRTIEISPAYCDVIIKRWENYTGHEARKEE